MSGKDAVCGSQSRQDLTKIKECIREDIIRCMNRERVVSDEEIKDMIQQRVLDLGHEMYFSVTQKQEMIQGIFNSLRKLDILQEIHRDHGKWLSDNLYRKGGKTIPLST